MGSIQSFNTHLVSVRAIGTCIHTLRQGFSNCYAYVQVAIVTNIHRMKQQTGVLLLLCVFMPDQSFGDCYVYV
jgi:hypothetical protein